jgi:hypothetical protein
MRYFPQLPPRRLIAFLFVLVLFTNCKKESISPDSTQPSPESISQSVVGNTVVSASSLSQTKTANRFNWNGNPYMNLWQIEGAQYLSANDNSFAYSKKLSSGRSFLSLVLQDFRFDLPANATIGGITVLVRRFKKGKASITDYFAWLYRSGSGFYNPSPYGVRWTDPTNYPDEETEVSYYQSGTGTSSFGCQPAPVGCPSYEWTPAMINDPDFGVRIDTYPPVGGSLTVYYDLATITVQYSLP